MDWLGEEHARVDRAYSAIRQRFHDERQLLVIREWLLATADLASCGDPTDAANWLERLADSLDGPWQEDPRRTWNLGDCYGLAGIIESEDPGDIAIEILKAPAMNIGKVAELAARVAKDSKFFLAESRKCNVVSEDAGIVFGKIINATFAVDPGEGNINA